MNKKLFLCFLAVLICGCASNTIVSNSYDFRKVKRIAVAEFTTNKYGPKGTDSILTRYLMEQGFTVIERAELEKIIDEQKLAQAGYISAETAKSAGRLLGVDAILTGEVMSYSSARTKTAVEEIRRKTEEPVYVKETKKSSDGEVTETLKPGGYRISQEQTSTPRQYTEFARAAVAAKLIDVETGEVIWTGSHEGAGSTLMAAVEDSAQYLMRQLKKDSDKAIERFQK
ncbi:MAG: hypothetical protein NTW04_01455 [Elusimicrobia bacterium]|nr:hypothetical protein [Elusimicrobiota bacterium]